MKDCRISVAACKPLLWGVMRKGTRCYLFSTEGLENAIAGDAKWSRRPRAYRLRYIFDAIIRQRLNVARVASRRGAVCNLSSRALTFAIGADYRESLDWLMARDLLGSDGTWRQGEKCIGYCLTPKGWRGGIAPVAMSEREIERYARARAALRRGSDEAREAEGVPLTYLRYHLGNLSLEDESVFAHFAEMPEAKTFQEAERIHAHSFAVAALKARDWTFHRCKAGRLHYAMTNLPKRLRRLLRYNGAPLVEIDVSSCQPFLAASLYSDQCEERGRYMADVQGGFFYEALGQEAQFAGDRAALKRAVLRDVFFGGRKQAQGIVWGAFARRYPVLAGILLESKSGIQAAWSGDSELALLLQAAEARIFIGGALSQIASERPDIPAFPVHDCFLTTAEHVAEIKGILRDQFQLHIGEVPSFAVKVA